MARNDTDEGDQERARVDLEACIMRAKRVRNVMALAIGALENAEFSPEWHEQKRRQIDAAFAALAGYGVPMENRLRLLEALDRVSRSEKLTGGAIHDGLAVIDELPPELALPFSAFADKLRDVVLAWRVKTPGRRKGHAAKWVELANVWEEATGESVSSAAWEQTAKTIARRRKSETAKQPVAKASVKRQRRKI